MSGSKSKNKGNSWERVVAKFLSERHNASFIRAPHSGAYIGGTNSFRKASLDASQVKSFKGDIVPPESWTYFNAEAKSYADFPFHQLYQGTIPILEKWIGQLLEVANTGDFNVLLMKFNRKGTYIACQPTPSLTLNPNYSTYISPNYGTWIIQDFESFWNTNSESIEQLCKSSR
jgi:hypothetical protein